MGGVKRRGKKTFFASPYSHNQTTIMKKIITYFLVCFAFSAFASDSSIDKNTEALIKAMYQLEKAYIPVNYYVHNKNMVGAKRTILALDHEWNKFNNRFAKMNSTKDWQDSFLRMGDWIADLCSQIEANHIEWSAASLSYFRYELTDLRCRYHIHYYFDFLYSFGDTWMVVQHIAKDDKMCLYEWNKFELFVAAAKRDWAISEQQNLPVEIMQIPEEELLTLMIKREKVSKLLQEFNDVLNCGDQGLLQKKTKLIEDAYFDFLRQFGRLSIDSTQMAEIF